MSSWIVDLRLHSVCGLPAEETSLVEIRVRYKTSAADKAVVQPCSTASSFDGVVFLGAWTRLAVEENEQEVQFEVSW
jgi:hypothetical protein